MKGKGRRPNPLLWRAGGGGPPPLLWEGRRRRPTPQVPADAVNLPLELQQLLPHRLRAPAQALDAERQRCERGHLRLHHHHALAHPAGRKAGRQGGNEGRQVRKAGRQAGREAMKAGRQA